MPVVLQINLLSGTQIMTFVSVLSLGVNKYAITRTRMELCIYELQKGCKLHRSNARCQCTRLAWNLDFVTRMVDAMQA